MFHLFLKKSKIVRNNFTLLVLVLTINLVSFLIFSPNKLEHSVNIIIKPGMKLNEITNLLYDKDIISNKLAFKIWVKINYLERELKYGEFSFKKEDTINTVTKKLNMGESTYRKITIVEGTYKYDLLSKLRLIDPNTELTIKDIPDEIIANTYNYQVTDKAERILQNIIKFSNNFSKEIWEKRQKSIPISKISEMYILASIVEKETALKREKSIIAGVFFNRLKTKMKLQSDPTVEFSITKGKKKLDRKLFRKDLKFISEFNTYVNYGLPPSIICFPGIDSLIAVSKPYKSDYKYFVSKNLRGEHFFSTNYKEHLENIRAAKNAK